VLAISTKEAMVLSTTRTAGWQVQDFYAFFIKGMLIEGH